MDRTFRNHKILSMINDLNSSRVNQSVLSRDKTISPAKTTSGAEKEACKNRNDFSTGGTLSDYLFNFPWTKFENSINNECEKFYRQSLIDGLQKYALQEPRVKINTSCHPPPLPQPKDIICSNYPHAFLPNQYKTPVKVAHAIQLGFDADSLEIHLNEIYDVIDHFFILESTRIHCKILRYDIDINLSN